MKFSVSIIVMLLLGFSAGLFLPWWSIAVTCFIVAVLIPQHPFDAFLCGFAAMALFWGGMAAYMSWSNDNILASRISLLIFNYESPYLLIAVTALTGALTGGLSSLTGSWIRHKSVK